jgi:hypothetical protein
MYRLVPVTETWVRSVLAQAGFPACKETSPHPTSGFLVLQTETGAISVRYISGTYLTYRREYTIQTILAQYRAALQQAGAVQVTVQVSVLATAILVLQDRKEFIQKQTTRRRVGDRKQWPVRWGFPRKR